MPRPSSNQNQNQQSFILPRPVPPPQDALESHEFARVIRQFRAGYKETAMSMDENKLQEIRTRLF